MVEVVRNPFAAADIRRHLAVVVGIHPWNRLSARLASKGNIFDDLLWGRILRVAILRVSIRFGHCCGSEVS